MAKKPPQKPWEITQADIDSITDADVAWGTTKFLPPVEEIPKEFFSQNIYVAVAQSMVYGEARPAGEVKFNEGFRPDGKALTRCLMAHLTSFQPDHDHKIAGVGYMISKIVHITAILT